MIRLRMRLRRSGFQLGHVFSDMEMPNSSQRSMLTVMMAFRLGHVFSDMEIFVKDNSDYGYCHVRFQLGHVFSDMEMPPGGV